MIPDHAGTSVTIHTRHDQRAVIVGVCHTTKRVMVSGRVDKRFPHRISGRPISLQSYEKLMEANAILTPMKAIHMELEAANKSDMSVHGMCNLDLSVHGLIINMDALVVDLNCHAILGSVHGYPRRCV